MDRETEADNRYQPLASTLHVCTHANLHIHTCPEYIDTKGKKWSQEVRKERIAGMEYALPILYTYMKMPLHNPVY